MFERVSSSQLSCLGAHTATDQHALIASLRLQLSQNTLLSTSFNKLSYGPPGCQYRARPKKLLWRNPFDEGGGQGQAVYATGHTKNAEPKTYFIPWLLSVQQLFKKVPVAGPLETSLKIVYSVSIYSYTILYNSILYTKQVLTME